MKNVALIITLLFYILFSLPVWGNRSEEVETALRELQYTIGLSDDYDRGKTKEIDALKSKLNHSRSYDTGYFLTSRLIEEYEAYLCDSALYYVNKNIVNARTRGDKLGEIRVLLTKCDILGRAGLFMEALDLLNTIDPESLDGELKQNYYSTAYSIAQFMYENATGTEYAVDYLRKTQLYCDSAVAYTTPGTFDYARLRAAQHLGRHEYGACISLLDSASQCYESGEREYSILRSTQRYAASKVDSLQDEALLWIAEAAISDIKGSIKENTASRALAERLYEQGRVKYANAFAKKSMEDASFFSARMRSAQSAQMLPIIDRQYERLQNESQERTRVAIVVLVGVAIGLAICLFLIVRLTHRLRSANDQLVESSEEVKELNRQQRYAAEETHQLNIKLREANKIKEAYLMQFMEMSSRSINSLERFRKSMLLLQATGKQEELRKSLKSSSTVNEALKELYLTFDKAFLTIFPDFVESFNALLKEDEKVHITPGESFSTELRIYALIRMGISDNHRISDFLRCSLSTIYTYRSKMKARAINPDTFEDKVMAIASISGGETTIPD